MTGTGTQYLQEPMSLFLAYECVIVLRFPSPNWTALEPLTQAVVERAKTFYNYSYAADEYVSNVSVIDSDILTESRG